MDISQTADKDLLKAYQAAKLTLGDNNEPTPEDLQKAAQRAVIFCDVQVDIQLLIRKLETSYSTWVAPGTVLKATNTSLHEDWLDEKYSSIKWKFWNRYSRYLRDTKDRPEKLVDELDNITSKILSMLEDPHRDGPWTRRGMVVGHVQSGKTANYTGLICKAADAGYNLIIVLAGIHNSLRSQTQRRLDEEFLGFDSRLKRKGDSPEGNRLGVGILDIDSAFANTATSSENVGDFKGNVASQYNLILGGNHPTLLVVKKNKTVLENVIKWATAHRSTRTASGSKLVKGIPLLIIDDEADQASIDTEARPKNDVDQFDPDTDPTAINSAIRKLLSSFEQSAYIGYTATPFANIFIHPDNYTSEHGKDLFPESFIVNLPAPSNYIGPEEFFTLLDRNSRQTPIRIVEDQDSWLEIGHKKSASPRELPPSLVEAIQTFFLICAIRKLRKQDHDHNSMLIHVTRFKEVQSRVGQLVRTKISELQSRLKNFKAHSTDTILEEFEDVWKKNLSEASTNSNHSWLEIVPALREISKKIKCKMINGDSKDVLDYADSTEPLNVIAVGGNKLSRGLTLDGLSVSYYLRASKMYDTLMQMGRWFGYRPGYDDLCKLYTTNDLVDWYVHITEAAKELRSEFDEMAFRGSTPKEFGLKVKTHPAGLQITAVNKMRSGIDMKVAYADTTNETVTFIKDDVKANFSTVEDFLSDIQECLPHVTINNDEDNDYIWSNIPPHLVSRFLKRYKTPETNRRCNGPYLARYIDAQTAKNELVNWTVILKNKKTATHKMNIANLNVGLLTRTLLPSEKDIYRMRRLASNHDLLLDLNAEQKQEALKIYNDYRTEKKLEIENTPADWAIRKVRSKNNGLIVLYPLDIHYPGNSGDCQ